MMIRIYLLLSFILNLFFPALTSPALATAVHKNEADLSVQINELNGLEVGSNVLNNGIIVGKVTFVDNTNNNFALIGVDLNHRVIKGLAIGTIGLIKSPMTIDPANRQTLLEFFTPQDAGQNILKKGSTIKGFSSFEEFWKADLGKSADSYETSSIS